MISIEAHARLFADAGWTLIGDTFPIDSAMAIEKVAIDAAPDDGIYKEGTSSGGGRSKYWVLDGETTHHLFPGIYDWYAEQVPLLSKIVARPVIVSPHARSAVNVKVYAENDGGQGWHNDTNPVSAVLYLSDCGAPTTIRDLQGYAWDIEPKYGRLLLMRGREILHCVDGSKGQGKPRVSCVLNYYHPDDFDRPEWIDRAIYENEDPPRLT